ncbi:DUF397 domain-containing protein [Amycolatopsis rubida]|uniref:DUF397 domain-containing protein n=1 Tax=Amycolatopsis rubida TaxID=112413 RepID=A0A1I5E2N1_9PSEU|nr:DUF397 domain-containing protein [Amycolatopsis rubida]SFO05774.1 protein of unknown function [Amycolatopsis rubida]
MDIQNGNKAHLDTDFREWVKSPLSNPNGNQCVELSFTSNAVGMRDSQNPDGAVPVMAERTAEDVSGESTAPPLPGTG